MVTSVGRSGNFHLQHWWKCDGALCCSLMDNYKLLVLCPYVIAVHNSRSNLLVIRRMKCEGVLNSVDVVIATRVTIIFVLTGMSHLQFCSILSRSTVAFIHCFFLQNRLMLVSLCSKCFKLLCDLRQ
jgi:hypothetical protein